MAGLAGQLSRAVRVDLPGSARCALAPAGLPLVADGTTHRVHVTTLGQDWEAA